MKKILGFTLSEVLIAMTILGVVSALTIPHIMGNTTKKQYAAAFKSTMNVLQSGAKEFKAEKGYDFSGNRTVYNGPEIFRSFLEEKLGGKLVKLRTSQQWVAQGLIASGYETIGAYCVPLGGSGSGSESGSESGSGSYSVVDIKTDIFFNTSALTNAKLSSVSTVQNLAFGTAEGSGSTYNPANANSPVGKTVKLPNGAYIFYTYNDDKGCNFKNVRWNGSSYDVPNMAASSNTNAKINLCLAYIDVNGPKGPNRITNCFENSVIISPVSTAYCNGMTSKEVADVYPILFFDDSVAPANAAAYTVLNDLLSD